MIGAGDEDENSDDNRNPPPLLRFVLASSRWVVSVCNFSINCNVRYGNDSPLIKCKSLISYAVGNKALVILSFNAAEWPLVTGNNFDNEIAKRLQRY